MEEINAVKLFQETIATHLGLVKATTAVILASVFLPIGGNLSAADSVKATKHLEPLPVTGTAEKPVIILEAEPLEGTVSTDTSVVAYGGKVVSHDAESCGVNKTSVIVSQPGYKASTIALSYTLEPRPKAGKYAVWTAFTVGGIGENSFTVSAGKTPDSLFRRMAFKQKNSVSWKTEWNKGEGSFVLLPSDKILVIEVTGMATHKKIFDAFLLEPVELFPPEMSEAGAALRASLTGTADPAKASKRLYVLEGIDVKAMDEMLAGIFQGGRADALTEMDVRYLMGAEAGRIAHETGISELPAIIMTDETFKIIGMTVKGSTKADVEKLLKTGMGSIPLPSLPEKVQAQPKPFAGGSPAEWLAVGCWAGPSGLSLLGVDMEKTILPSAGDPCIVMKFDTAIPTQWKALQSTGTGVYVIESPTANNIWARGTGHAFLYFKVESEIEAVLHVSQSGIRTAGWLDGEPLKFSEDKRKPVAEKQNSDEVKAVGRTDQGNTFEVKIDGKEGSVAAPFTLSPGWHRLMLKLVMQHKDGETFQFAAKFTDKNGNPLQAVGTVVDPGTNPSLHLAAQRMVPFMFVNNPVSLPRPGDPLKMNVEFRNYPLKTSEGATIPTLPLKVKLSLAMTDYDGKEILRREVDAELPGKMEVDLGVAPGAGYYAVHPALLTQDGKKIIAVYPPDGFSVLKGTAAQAKRKDMKKMATTYYFLAGRPSKYHRDGISVESTFEWMNRMGIYRNVGSSPGFNKELWDLAKDMGIIMSADFWDMNNSETPEQKKSLAVNTAKYGRWYKSFNEVDLHPKVRGTPEHWVNRTKIEYEAVKSARADGFYVGGSLVRVGAADQKGWFEECLKLGLDKYQDAWDVHAYPQYPPVLGGSISNSPNETELGVINTFKKIGRINSLPFWIGETGARAGHGYDARRWQAETVAKMTAWANSRSDIQVIAFLIPFMYSRNVPAIGGKSQSSECDIQTGHQPAEAAYYTASALIDGMPYRKVEIADSGIQAAYFGKTLMLWSVRGDRGYQLHLEKGRKWLVVDVVGRVRTLETDDSGFIKIILAESPVYILDQDEYEGLTTL